jgi:hypothetical protein
MKNENFDSGFYYDIVEVDNKETFKPEHLNGPHSTELEAYDAAKEFIKDALTDFINLERNTSATYEE